MASSVGVGDWGSGMFIRLTKSFVILNGEVNENLRQIWLRHVPPSPWPSPASNPRVRGRGDKRGKCSARTTAGYKWRHADATVSDAVRPGCVRGGGCAGVHNDRSTGRAGASGGERA